MADQLANFLFAQPHAALGPGDVYIRVDLKRVQESRFLACHGGLDPRRGRRAADSALATATCLPLGADPRRDRLPDRVASFTLTGGAPTDADVLQRFLGLEPGQPIDEPALARQVDEVSQLGSYTSLWLHPDRRRTSNGVAFHAVGPAGALANSPASPWPTTGTSAVALGLMYLDRRLLGHALEGSVTLGVGTLLNDVTGGLRRYFGAGQIVARADGHAPLREPDDPPV